MVITGSRWELIEPVDLFRAQLNGVGGNVLLDARDPFGARNRGDVVTLGQQPSQGDLSRRRSDFRGDRRDLVGESAGSARSSHR